MANMSVKKGDTVKVIAGKERGKIGKVLKILGDKNRVLVEKVNIVKRHTKPNQENKQGGVLEKEASIHVSNVMVMCEKCNKPVRIRHKVLKDKTKVRTCHVCGESFKK